MTLKGITQEVILPNSTYGEWIVYENSKPKYHVKVFNFESKSDCLVSVIKTENESEFENILVDINERFERKLSLVSKNNFGIKIYSELMELDLGSLPFEWIRHYTKLIKAPWERYPNMNPKDMFWRTGKGEDTISTFARYYYSLNQIEKDVFKNEYKPSAGWSDFYE